jgi:uncharacterized damage-inducible protein DinB
MDTFLMDFLDCMESNHEKIKQEILGLHQPVLDWTPRAGMGSLCMVITHVIGSERYWVGEVACRKKSIRPAGAVYRVTGLDANELHHRLDESSRFCRVLLEKCAPADLDEKRLSPRDGVEVTGRWALRHVLEHSSTHQYDVIMIRRLWQNHLQKQVYSGLDREKIAA